MKKLRAIVGLSFLFFLGPVIDSQGQYVGIDVVSPTAKLHVGTGTVRFEGPSAPGGDALSIGGTGRVRVDAPNIVGGRFVITDNGNVGIGTPDPLEKLHVEGTTYFNGNVGIGTSSPGFPLNFDNSLGDKISFWGNSGSHYGIGIQGFLLQIHTDGSSSDIAFGYGSSGSFTETMRIKGNGNVGIGNNNPSYILDVSQRMRLRSGGNNGTSAGIWFNNNSNSLAAFLGMEDDTHIGFLGNGGAGWKFSMNTQTGALKINSSEGQSGQVITSQGSGTATWASPTNQLYFNTIGISSVTSQTITQAMGSTDLTGMSYTFTINSDAKAFISYSIPVLPIFCTFCGATTVYVDVDINAVLINRSSWGIANATDFALTNAKVISLVPGTYTVKLKGSVVGNPTAFGCFCALEKILNIQIIPR